jgi:cytochrome c oxidase subunit 1
MGWGGLNLLSTAGAYLLAAGVLVYLLNLVVAYRRGTPAPANPWGGGGLEWATASPPPAYNFGRTPLVEKLHPLWKSDPLKTLDGLSDIHRDILLTTVTDAAPDVRHGSPGPSIWPLLTALAVTALFIGSIFDEWWLVWLSPPVGVCITGWFWPKTAHSKKAPDPEHKVPPGALA